MADLDSYISKARGKGISDQHIKKTLLEEGWDAPSVEAGLGGLTVPKPPSGALKPQQHSDTTSSLQSALHHVLLWTFLLSATIAISAVTASLFGSNVSTSALASLIAVTIVTFTPFLVFFILYLLKVRKNPKTIPGKVWSIITICFASVGAMAAAISLVVGLVTESTPSWIVGSSLIITLYAITLIVYGFATFYSEKLMKLRQVILIAALPAFIVLMGTLFIMSLLQIGPARHDEAMRTALVKTTENIRDSVRKTSVLPSQTDARHLIANSSITYEVKSLSTYELCTTFDTTSETAYKSSYSSEDTTKPIKDSYAYETYFNASSGKQCFTIESSKLSGSSFDNL